MPCDSVITNQVQWNQQTTDMTLFTKAMEAMGYKARSGSRIFTNGYSTVEFDGTKVITRMSYGQKFDVNELKQNYSKEVIKSVKSRFSWMQEEQKGGLKGKLRKRV